MLTLASAEGTKLFRIPAFQKLGWALGPALAGYLLVYYDYQPNVAQAPRTVEGLRMMMSWLPSALGVASALHVFAYGINRDFEQRMSRELTEARPRRHARLSARAALIRG